MPNEPGLIILLMLLFVKALRGATALESLTLTPLCMETSSVRKKIFSCFSGVFSAIYVEIRKKYARKTIAPIRFIALALVGTLGSCLNTRPSGIGTLQMLMHEKMYDLIISF